MENPFLLKPVEFLSPKTDWMINTHAQPPETVDRIGEENNHKKERLANYTSLSFF